MLISLYPLNGGKENDSVKGTNNSSLTDNIVCGQDYEIVLYQDNTEGLDPKYLEKQLFAEDDNILHESVMDILDKNNSNRRKWKILERNWN